MNTTLRRTLAVSLATLALAAGSQGLAQGKGPGGGGGEEETAANNLSVPTIFVVGHGPFAGTCAGTATSPVGDPLTGYEVAGWFYVQKVHTWQAACADAGAGTVTVTVDWGDNLEGTSLKAGTPIRVEVGLETQASPSMPGFTVVKLEPSKLDRLSAYGVAATGNPTEGYTATPDMFTTVRAFDGEATFSLYNDTTDTWVVAENTPMGTEINSMGKIVYAYNWGMGSSTPKPTAGDYVLEFTAPNLLIQDEDEVTADDHVATLEFTVKAGGGGKKGR